MRIDNTGNVGIGSTAPVSKLDVNGTITATGFSGPITSSVVSPSVQATLFEMASAVLDAEPAVEEINLTMPNLHRHLINLAPFDLDNPNVLFLPTDEPHGNITASVCRERPEDAHAHDHG